MKVNIRYAQGVFWVVVGLAVLVHAVPAQQVQQPRAIVAIYPTDQANLSVMPVVTFRKTEDCDHAILTVFRYQKSRLTLNGYLLLSSVSVVPCVPGASVGADPVPAPLGMIASTQIVFVRDLASEKQTFNEAPK